MIQLRVTAQDSGKRLDKFLYDSFQTESIIPNGDKLSRSQIKESVVPLFRVNGISRKGSATLAEEDLVNVDRSQLEEAIKQIFQKEEALSGIIPQISELDILNETEQYIVINKPHGVAVHPGHGNYTDTIANYIKGYFESNGYETEGLVRSGIVHRLDKPVGGLMVIAKNREYQQNLKDQFENREVLKIYHARFDERVGLGDDAVNLVKEISEEWRKSGNYDLSGWEKVEGYIARDPNDRIRMSFSPVKFSSVAKSALSYIKYFDQKREAVVLIKTGRMHQIRATLAYMNTPIYGDTLYGSGRGIPEKISLRSVVLGFREQRGERVVYSLHGTQSN